VQRRILLARRAPPATQQAVKHLGEQRRHLTRSPAFTASQRAAVGETGIAAWSRGGCTCTGKPHARLQCFAVLIVTEPAAEGQQRSSRSHSRLRPDHRQLVLPIRPCTSLTCGSPTISDSLGLTNDTVQSHSAPSHAAEEMAEMAHLHDTVRRLLGRWVSLGTG
jgi:hypothetical protein